MPVHNREIVTKLTELADLLDIKGGNEFRVRAYRNATRSLSGITRNIAEMVNKGEDLSALPGIGQRMTDKIREIVETGTLKQLDKLRKEIPPSLIDIMHLEQIGPHRTKLLRDELKIKTIDDLRKAAEAGKLEHVKGFGKKTVEKILSEIEAYTQKGGSGRIKRS